MDSINHDEALSELDSLHEYRNALATALAGVTGNEVSACTSAANTVIDREILPPVGELRDMYADCGRMAMLYLRLDIAYHHTTGDKHLYMGEYAKMLLEANADALRRIASRIV